MRRTTYFILLSLVISIIGCKKDPMTEITDGDWNKERNIINITFEGQVGEASIVREGEMATIGFTYNTDAGQDLSSIQVKELEISYGAGASISIGETLNFQNSTNTAIVTITPANGDPLEWEITLTPFTETILGTWDITGLWVYGGTGPEYGGSALARMIDKSWCWSTTEGPAQEENNTLTFTMTGITDDGNTYGTVVNDAGSDGKYADFIFVAKTPNIDVNHFYRTIPKGEGSWLRDYSTNTVTFTFSDGTTRTASFDGAGTYDLGNGKSKTVNDNAFTFTLNGTDDWVNIYSDYDIFVQNPRKYWIDIKKQ